MRALNPHRSAAGLDTWNAHGILSLGRPRIFSAGDVLLAQGPAARHAAVITRGLVKITADGGTFLTIRGAGDLIGEDAAILGPQAGLTVATALTSGAARVFTAEQLRRFLEERPAAMLSAAQGLCERLADAESRVASAGRDSADRRLARVLYELERYGRHATPDWAHGREGTVVPISLTHAELASWVGVSRETVDRALRRWRTRRIVSTGVRKIMIHDAEALARIAGIKDTRLPAVRPGTGRITVDLLRRRPEPSST